MKTRPILLHAAAVCATLAPVGLAAERSTAEFKPFTLNLRPGSSPDAARAALGTPDATLGPWIWIYWNFGPNRENPRFDTLVVAFDNDRVFTVKITDGRVVRQALAQAAARNAKPGTNAVASSKP